MVVSVGVQFIGATGQIAGHIDRKGKVAATMVTGLFAVHPDPSFPVHRSKVEKHAVTSPVRRHCERGGVPGV